MTCDVGSKDIVTLDIPFSLYSTCDIGENRRQSYATLPFFKIDMQHWGPGGRILVGVGAVGWRQTSLQRGGRRLISTQNPQEEACSHM